MSETLNALAGKLFYPGQWTGSKNHLTGKVEIAEGLTASAAGLRIGDITYKFGDGQGQYLYTPATDIPDEQIINPMKQTMDGSASSEKAYTDAAFIKQPKTPTASQKTRQKYRQIPPYRQEPKT